MLTSKVTRAVQAVQAVQDKRWIPENLRDWSFFSQFDVWEYTSDNTENRCWNCSQFLGITFFGDELRSVFPDLVILSAQEIWPNVHRTLWDVPTCQCRLVRVAEPKAPKFGLKELLEEARQN